MLFYVFIHSITIANYNKKRSVDYRFAVGGFFEIKKEEVISSFKNYLFKFTI